MPDKYAAERTRPEYPACRRAGLTLWFDGVVLRGIGAVRPMNFPAVSGQSVGGKFGYSVDRQKLADVGPIPAGTYWILPSEMQRNAWYRWRNPRAAWGNHWITIHPLPGTVTHGRGGFFIHGGNVPGSIGCIDLSLRMDAFVATLEAELAGEPSCHVPLIVRYPE